jgi:hypothetical protein
MAASRREIDPNHFMRVVPPVLILSCFLTGGLTIHAQSHGTPATVRVNPKFEVASIKPNTANNPVTFGVGNGHGGGTNVTSSEKMARKSTWSLTRAHRRLTAQHRQGLVQIAAP